MECSIHCQRRMSQRGITRKMVDFTLNYGEIEGDRWILDRKVVEQAIIELEESLRVAKKIRDKGGIVVIAEDNKIITTYNRESRH